jgi:hypothetical protein
LNEACDIFESRGCEAHWRTLYGVKHKDLTPAEAEKAIGGYLIFNDVTARDIQATEFVNRSYGYSKALDTFCPIGPCIVTPDEIGDVGNLNMSLRLPFSIGLGSLFSTPFSARPGLTAAWRQPHLLPIQAGFSSKVPFCRQRGVPIIDR